jgi:putative tryptophan/tyrosine transport system substrate-binding protein
MKHGRVRRREFITLLGSAAVWPLAAHAQSDRVRRIGVMIGGTGEHDMQSRAWIAAFQQGLKDLGWIEGRNLRIDYRWPAGDLDRARMSANELVALQPDAILAGNTPSVIALLRETHTIPIVFTNVSDPVGSGLIGSLAHPGGNVTGLTAFASSLGGKWLQLLKELAPGTERVAVIFNPDTAPFYPSYVSSIEGAAPAFSVRPVSGPVRDVRDIEDVISKQGREPGGSIIALPDSFTNAHRALMILSMAKFRVPAIYALRDQAADGGLISYGPDSTDLYRRAASYVDRILRGTNPGDLPVQQPTKYELVINLQTAKALDITVPLTLQASAEEVIE